MRATKEQIQQEALSRAASGQSLANWPAILAGFTAKGIAESDIRPRENVFTYHAWRALGRQVRRGEHGVKVCTYVSGECEDRERDPQTGEERTAKRSFRRPWTATVFHVSQTDPVSA
jgi:hypothetical protein